MKITPSSEYKGSQCPACGSNQISAGDVSERFCFTANDSVSYIAQKVDCEKCLSSWVEVFQLEGFENLELSDMMEKWKKHQAKVSPVILFVLDPAG